MTTADLDKEVSYWCKLVIQFAPLNEIAHHGLKLVQDFLQAASHKTGLDAARAALDSFFREHCAGPFLLPQHQQLLAASGIKPEVATARGYRSVTKKKDLQVLGFNSGQQSIPALLIPIHSTTGQKTYQTRPDSPRTDKQGKTVKYETPAGGQLMLDVNPFIPKESLRAPSVPLFITEGSRKADSAISQGLCCISLLGVNAFRGTNEFGGKTAFPEWETVALNGRLVYLAFDSDVMEKRSVYGALRRLADFLSSRGALVRFVYLPSGEGGTKTGLDDFFASGKNRDDLLRCALDMLLQPSGVKDKQDGHDTFPYTVQDGQIVFQTKRTTPAGDELFVSQPVADFSCYIEEEITTENGLRSYRVAGTGKRGGSWFADLPASALADERTLCSALLAAAGAYDGIYAGMKRHLGPALNKLTNGDLRRVRRFERTGWDGDTFLIPGREPEDVKLALKQKLPYKVGQFDLDNGLTALNSLLESGGGELCGPIVAFLLGAPLARVAGWGERYCLFVVGRSGTLKTSTMQTALCLYGPDFFKDENLIRWGQGATQNALMHYATFCADLPFLIDNYKPGTSRDPNDFVKLIHALIEGGEKDRLKKDSELKEARTIHAWPCCTGEDCPDSDPATLARCLVVEFPNLRRQVNHPLATAQELSPDLCAVGNAWLDWLESETGRATATKYGRRLAERRAAWAEHLTTLRADMVNPLRVAGNLAMNELAWMIAEYCPALAPILSKYRDGFRKGLSLAAKHLSQATAESLEAQRFLSTLRQLIATEQAQLLPIGDEPHDGIDRNKLIGWKDTDGSIFIAPDITLALIYSKLGRTGLNSISPPTLYNQLDMLNALQSKDHERKTKEKRVTPTTRGRFLHLSASALAGDQADEENQW